jgi:hypothetical protein
MRVAAGTALEGSPAWQGDLVAQQAPLCRAGPVLGGEVDAVGEVNAVGGGTGTGVFGVRIFGGRCSRRGNCRRCGPLRDRAGPNGDGVEFSGNPGDQASVH